MNHVDLILASLITFGFGILLRSLVRMVDSQTELLRTQRFKIMHDMRVSDSRVVMKP